MRGLNDALQVFSETGDRKRRAVVFYGTGSSAEISNAAEYFQWVRATLELFRNREEILLLWYPQIKTEDWHRVYGSLVREYQESGWGILVESGQLQEAIDLADAYYGDKCPVSVLFKLTGKPMRFRGEDVGEYLLVETLKAAGDTLWATSGGKRIDGLYQIDCQTFSACYQGIPVEKKSYEGNYSEILEHEGKLYLIPRRSDYLVVYDITGKNWNSYRLEEPGEWGKSERREKFRCAAAVGKTICLFPSCYPAIVKFHTSVGRLEYFHDCMETVLSEVRFPWFDYIDQVFQCEGDICLYSRFANMLLRFEPERCELEILERFEGETAFDRVEYDEKRQNFWFIPPNNQMPILKWNLKTHKKVEIRNPLTQLSYRKVSFCNSICTEQYLWFLPGLADGALKIDLESEKVELSPEFKPGYDAPGLEQWKYVALERYGNCLYAYDGSDGQFVEWDLILKKGRRSRIKIEGKPDRAIFLECSEFLDNIAENHELPERDELGGKEDGEKKQQVGKRIFEYLKERSLGI